MIACRGLREAEKIYNNLLPKNLHSILDGIYLIITYDQFDFIIEQYLQSQHIYLFPYFFMNNYYHILTCIFITISISIFSNIY